MFRERHGHRLNRNATRLPRTGRSCRYLQYRLWRALDSVPQEGHSERVRPSARTSQPCSDFSNPNNVRPISGGSKSCALNSLDMASLDVEVPAPAPKVRKNL